MCFFRWLIVWSSIFLVRSIVLLLYLIIKYRIFFLYLNMCKPILEAILEKKLYST